MFLVGRPPFDGQNNIEIIHSIRHKNYDQNNEKLLKHSPEVRDLISHLLVKDINKRFSAKEALNHIWFKKFDGRKIFGNFEEKDIQPFIDNLFNYSFTSKIQPLVIAFLVHNLPSTESCHIILKLYRYFNESGDCKLTKEELIKGLKKFRKMEEIEKKVDNLFKILDADINGFIEYEEFLRACIDKRELFNDAYLKYAFKFLDRNNNNVLSSEQIISSFLVKKQKNDLFELSIINAINEVDEDEDGKINFKEFKRLMLKSMN
jgi:calcium-dependent protein kinase